MLGTQIGVKMTAIILLLDTTKQYILGGRECYMRLKSLTKERIMGIDECMEFPTFLLSFLFVNLSHRVNFVPLCLHCEESIKRLYLAPSECWKPAIFNRSIWARDSSFKQVCHLVPKPMVFGLIKGGLNSKLVAYKSAHSQFSSVCLCVQGLVFASDNRVFPFPFF